MPSLDSGTVGAVSWQPMSNPYQGYTEADVDTPGRTMRKPRRNRTGGTYAGVLALSLAVHAIAGVVWGFLRPTYTAYVEDPETASVAVSANVEFTAFIWFAIATGVIGAGIALVVFLRSETTRGPLMLLWLGVVAFLGAVAFIVFGDAVATFIHPSPGDYAGAVGESFQVVPGMSPGSALFTAPFLAVLMYWCATFVTPPEEPEED